MLAATLLCSTGAPIVTRAADQEQATAGDSVAANEITRLRSELRTANREHGPYAPQLIPILSELAATELAAGEKEFAAGRLERVIELRRLNDGFYAPSLTTPLLQLANIYLEAGLYDRAITKLRYAQHLTHRRDGVYSLEQVDLIENLARAFLGQDEPDEAQREMKLAYDISHRVHGKTNVLHVPGMLRFAAWYRFIGEDRKARRLYKNAIEMLEAEHGPDHPSLIAPLTSLSATASQRGFYRGERELALLRADQILNSQPGVDTEDRVISAIRLGDFYTNLRDAGNARVHYQRAWEEMQDEKAARFDPEAVFAGPVVLNFPHSVLPDTRRGVHLVDREVRVTYDIDIDPTGKVSRVEVVDHTGPAAITRTLRKTGFTLRFRPELNAGKPTATRNFTMTESLRIESPISRSLFEEEMAKQIEHYRRIMRLKQRRRSGNSRFIPVGD